MDHSKQLGEESIGKLLGKFSFPAIIGMLVNALYNIVDRIFVGHGVGLLGISATTVAFPITILIMAFGILIGAGAAVSVSIKLGQQRKDLAEAVLGNALAMAIGVSIFITISGLIFEEPLLRIFGASNEVMPLAKQFTSIILAGAILPLVGLSLNNIIRAEGNPKTAMLTMLIGAGLNAVFNPLFIFGLHLGIRGSALATIVSQTVTSVWVIAYFLRKKSLLKMKRDHLKLNAGIAREIVDLGMASFLLQLVASVITVVFNQSVKTYGGDMAIAAIGIINSVGMLILMPVIGISQGAQPIIGYNYGAQNQERVKEALKLSIIASTIVSFAGFIFVQLFPSQIIAVFSEQSLELLKIGPLGLRIFLLMLPIIGFQIAGSNYFQAVGQTKIAIFLTLTRQIIFLLPALLILPCFFRLNGAWIAAPVSDFLASVVTGRFLLREIKILRQTAAGA
ncbi:MAG: MATE family efflux transporter [Bacillota bacterium]